MDGVTCSGSQGLLRYELFKWPQVTFINGRTIYLEYCILDMHASKEVCYQPSQNIAPAPPIATFSKKKIHSCRSWHIG